MMHVGLALLFAMLASCAGYRLGGAKPPQMASVDRIAIPMFRNDTLHPRAEVLATSAMIDAMTTDGTYRLSNVDQADAVLEGTVTEIGYAAIRGSRLDTLLPQELTNRVTIRWTLKDARNPMKTLASGTSVGRSQLFVASNLQTARNNALPEAMERAASDLVGRLSNSF